MYKDIHDIISNQVEMDWFSPIVSALESGYSVMRVWELREQTCPQEQFQMTSACLKCFQDTGGV